MNLSTISNKLETHLAALPHAPPIVFENTEPRPKGDTLILCHLMPNDSRTDTFCLTRKQRGLFSVRIFTPLGKGRRQAQDLADAVTAHFRHVDLGGLFCRNVQVATAIASDSHYCLPLTVEYETLET